MRGSYGGCWWRARGEPRMETGATDKKERYGDVGACVGEDLFG